MEWRWFDLKEGEKRKKDYLDKESESVLNRKTAAVSEKYYYSTHWIDRSLTFDRMKVKQHNKNLK